MMRLLVENAVLFLLPSALYFGYVALVRGPKPAGAGTLNDAPVIWLMIGGAMLVVFTLVAFSTSDGGKPGEAYTPAVLKNGQIEPGRIEHVAPK